MYHIVMFTILMLSLLMTNLARDGYFVDKKVSNIIERLAIVINGTVLGSLLTYGYFVFVRV